MHALIIEDQFLVTALIEDALTDLGYTSFDTAAGQAEAIRLAAQRCPDLITADEMLTEGSGIAAVRAICAHQAIPVVFITADAHEIDIPDVVRLAKPFRIADLEQAVEQSIATARTYA